MFDHVRRDIRYAVRGLIRTPGFTALAVASLALGIMATTAIYSVLHAVVLDPFPYKDVDNLMSVRVANPTQRGGRLGYSTDQFLEIAERNTIFEGTIASTITDVMWIGDGEPQRLRGNYGTFNTFDVMGVAPLIGRTPTADDAKPGAEPVAVLGYRCWQRQFGGRDDVLGKRLQLNGTVRTVIGVMPKRFMWRGADVYVPVAFQRGQILDGIRNVHLLGRLKQGVTPAQAEADLAPIITDLRTKEPSQFPEQWRVSLLPFKETFPSSIAGDIWVLLGAVALLLLIACANVSNLLLSRAAVRQREMTVRAALGASRTRLIRQLLTESLMLALAAGIVGIALAYAGLPAVLALVPPDTIPDEAEIAMNLPVLAFALLVSAAASVICGLAPALHSSRRDIAQGMREASRSVAGNSRQALLRKTLIIAEVALSLMLLAGSSALLRAFVSMRQVDFAVPTSQVLTMRVPLPAQSYAEPAKRVAFFKELLERLQAVPDVAAAAVNTGLHPLGNMTTAARVAGEAPSEDPVEVHHVSAGYTDVFGIRLASGRMLTDRDVNTVQHVALVNERFARARLNGRDPLGQSVSLPRLKAAPFNLPDDTFQIVGVVHDSLNAGLTNPVAPEIYLPFTVTALQNILFVRTHGDAAAATKSIVGQVYAIDPVQPVTSVMTLERVLQDEEYATPRFNLVLLSIFASVGLVLAAVGVYGVMSSAVAQERQEIGVRMALGATSGDVARMIVARGFRLLLIGTVLGLAGSYAAGRWLAGQVWHVPSFDALAFGAVAVILLIAGLQACAWPAWRAARIDPIQALRE